MWTPLHRELGIEPTDDLTYDLLQQAVAQGIVEQADLDWKRQLPSKVERAAAREEFAKDVAAMANGAGGLIVYGIQEDGDTSAAAELTDAGDVGQDVEKSLRQAAYTQVRPSVVGLEMHPLVGPEGKRALVVRVHSSVEAPHLIYKDPYFGAPIRNGRDTAWMNEPALERAFRERFRGQGDLAAELDRLFDFDAEALLLSQQARPVRVWLLVVAKPVEPRPSALGEITAEQASMALLEAQTIYSQIIEGRDSPQVVDYHQVRPGPRRWSVIRDADEEDSRHVGVDGSVIFAQAVGGHAEFDGNEVLEVPGFQVELAGAHALSLIGAVSRQLSTGPHAVRFCLVWPGAEAVLFSHGRGFRPRRDLVVPHVPVFTPQAEAFEVDGEIPNEQLRSVMRRLALAVTTQGGLDRMQYLTAPTPPADAAQS